MADEISVGAFDVDNAGPVMDYLKDRGFSTETSGPEAVVIRDCKDRSRLPLVHSTGTDRDKDSRYGMGEKALVSLGLNPEDIIYAQKLRGEMFYETLQVIPGHFYLLYDPKKIKRVVHEGKILEGHSWQVKEGHTFLDALILVILAERRV